MTLSSLSTPFPLVFHILRKNYLIDPVQPSSLRSSGTLACPT